MHITRLAESLPDVEAFSLNENSENTESEEAFETEALETAEK